jgi:hypothetical protein
MRTCSLPPPCDTNRHLLSRDVTRYHAVSLSECPRIVPAGRRFGTKPQRCSAAKDSVDAREDKLRAPRRKLAHPLGELLLSRATIRETFAIESFDNPVSWRGKSTLPGAFAHLRLLVSGTHMTVPMRLRLSALPCTTTTGRRYPASDPAGSSRSAHQTSACSITTQLSAEPAAPRVG